jgi:hypothetical protein
MRVWPRPDGTCPSCNGLITHWESPPPPKPSSAVIKRPPKAADRKKSVSRTGRSAASSTAVRDIEPVYQDYLQTAKEVRQGTLGVFYRYLAGGIAFAVVCIIVSFLTWQEKLVEFTKKLQPVPLTWVLIWCGIVVGIGIVVLGAFQGDHWGHVQAREIAKDRIGFADFYRAFLKRSWPKEGMISGPMLDTFLVFIGRK